MAAGAVDDNGMGHAMAAQLPGRQRRTLVLRYRPQYRNRTVAVANAQRHYPGPEAIQERLSPQVRELMDYAHYTDVKEIAKEKVVRLT